MSLSVIFVLLQWTKDPSELMVETCGILGLISLLFCHGIQLRNIVVGKLYI